MIVLTEQIEIPASYEKLKAWTDNFEEEFVKWSPYHIEDFLRAVLDHPLKVWAVIRFGRVGTVNVGADHSDAVLLGVVLAVAQLSLNGRFTLAVG